jgi:hypothetical protein
MEQSLHKVKPTNTTNDYLREELRLDDVDM